MSSTGLNERRLLTRERLLGPLAGRFRRRLTIIEAGAGFGKTTVLDQAIAENWVAKLGTDIVLRCQDEHREAGLLERDLLELLPSAPDVYEAVHSLAPTEATIVLDDVHRVEIGSPGAATMRALIDGLPANGHVVVSGRSIPFPTSRLKADSDSLILRDADLAFTSDELVDLAALRGEAVDRVADSEGWPALTELRLQGENVGQFLSEEFLDRLEPARLDAFLRLAQLGTVDPALADAVLAEQVDLEALLDGVPLVRRIDGAFDIHELWRDHVARVQPDDVRREVFRRAASHFTDNGDISRAFETALAADDLALAGEIARRAVGTGEPLVHNVVLARWAALLPAEWTEQALVLGVVEAQADRTKTKYLDDARDRFDAAADFEGKFLAVAQLARVMYWRRDSNGLDRLADEAAAMADSFVPGAAAAEVALRGLAMQIENRFAELAHLLEARGGLAENEGHWADTLRWLRAGSQLRIGDVAASRATAGDVTALTGQHRVNLGSIVVQGYLLDGDIELALTLLGMAVDTVDQQSSRAPRVLVLSTALQVQAAHGPELCWVPTFERLLREYVAVPSRPIADGEILVALRTHGDAAAASLFASVAPLDEHQATGAFWLLMGSWGLHYVLAPKERSLLDTLKPGPASEIGMALVRAFVNWREQGRAGELAQLDWSVPHRLRPYLPIPWATEAAIVAVAHGADPAGGFLDLLGELAVGDLQRLATHSNDKVAKAARDRLRGVAVRPPVAVAVQLLGAPGFWRGGEDLTHNKVWRRDRVRGLFTYLVLHGRSNRDDVISALWPEATEQQGRNNLKVTLNYLNSILEPERDMTPPYFVRSEGAGLRLVADRQLRIDVWDFEQKVADGFKAEAAGAASRAAVTLGDAADLYGGLLLEGAERSVWAEMEAERLRSLFVRASSRAGELLLAGGDIERASEIARRGLEADGWSENLHRLRASCFHAGGDRAAAVRALDRAAALMAELGLEPSPETTALRARIAQAR